MSSLAVIWTSFRRPWAYERIAASLAAQTRPADHIWVMFEAREDCDPLALAVRDLYDAEGWQVYPRSDENPLSYAINQALGMDRCDYITYLTDDSLPDPRKYEVMARALDENPDWGIVYCSQDFGVASSPEDWLAGGRNIGIRQAHPIEDQPFCVVDHTQVMHRRTKARWPLDYGSRRLSDAHFWVDLVADLGPMHGIGEVLDWTRQLPDGLSTRA